MCRDAEFHSEILLHTVTFEHSLYMSSPLIHSDRGRISYSALRSA